MITAPQKSFNKFINALDEYFKQNWKQLTCADIYNFYNEVFKKLKEVKGNSHGFTGRSELFIWEIIWHQLGGEFDSIPLKKNGLLQFQSKNDAKICIGQSIGVSVKGHRRYPDISIYYLGKLIGVISIKLYLTNGMETLREEELRFKEFREEYPDNDIRTLLIIYSGVPEKGTIRPELEKFKEENEWFNYLVLEEISLIFWKELGISLGLERIAKRKEI